MPTSQSIISKKIIIKKQRITLCLRSVSKMIKNAKITIMILLTAISITIFTSSKQIEPLHDETIQFGLNHFNPLHDETIQFGLNNFNPLHDETIQFTFLIG